DAVGFDMQVTVEEITGNDDYLRKVTAATGPTTRTIYWGRSEDHFALSFHYKDSGGDSAYKGFYFEDIANSTMAFELQSLKLTAPENVSFFRFFLDESESVAEVKAVGSLKDMGDAGKHVRWTMSGDLSGTNEF